MSLRNDWPYRLVRFEAEVALADYAETQEQRIDARKQFRRAINDLIAVGADIYGTVEKFMLIYETYIREEEGYFETDVEDEKYMLRKIFDDNEIYDVDIDTIIQ